MIKKTAASPLWLFIAAFALRFFHLGQKCFWTDEAFSYEVCLGLRYDDSTPMLFYNLVKPFLNLPFSMEINGRFLPALIGALTVFVIYFLGARFISKKYAIIIGWFAAINPVLIVLSQDLRAYGLVTLFASILFLAFVSILKTAENNSSADRNLIDNIYLWYVIFIFAGTVGLYTHYIFIPVLFIFGFLFLYSILRGLLDRRQFLKVVVAFAAIGLLFLPALAGFSERMSYRMDETKSVFYSIYSIKALFKSLWGFNLGYIFKMSWITNPLTVFKSPADALLVISSTILAVYFIIALIKNLKSKSLIGIIAVSYVLFLFIHIFIAISDYRQISAVLIPFIIMLSFTYYNSAGWKKYLLFASMLISFGGGLVWYYLLPYSPMNPADFKAAANYIDYNFREGDAVYAFMSDLSFLTFDRYYNKEILVLDDKVRLYHTGRESIKRREDARQMYSKHMENLKILFEKHPRVFVICDNNEIGQEDIAEFTKYNEISSRKFGDFCTILEFIHITNKP